MEDLMFRTNVRFAKTSKLLWPTYTVVLALVLMLPKPTRAQTDTAYGTGSLASDTSGIDNSAFGYLALHLNTGGTGNTATGGKALYSNTGTSTGSTGSYNTATGYGTLYINTTGVGNTAIGFKALLNNSTWNYNTAIGYEALYNSGSSSTGFGGGNTATGAFALYSSTSNRANTADGQQALYSNTTGQENTGLGFHALYSNTTGSDLTCIGYECNAAADAITNATAVGAHAVVGQSNSLVLGGTDQYAVMVGIGTKTPSNVLTIGRGAGHPVSDSWETYSSRRWKKNIHPLENALSKVEQLRGVSYDLKDSGKHEIGVIAEEVGQVVPEVVSYEKNGKDATGVDYSRLTALLIEAVKQQQKQIVTEQKQIALQQSQIRQQQRLMTTQQHEIAGLSHQVGVLKSSLRSDGETASVLVSRVKSDSATQLP
jgi:trimeric autotransporter adhesin